MALKPAPPELEEINLFDGLLFTPVGTSIDLFYGYENHVEFFMLRSDSTGVDFPYFILQDAIFNQVREIERVKANLCFQKLEQGQTSVRNTVSNPPLQKLIRLCRALQKTVPHGHSFFLGQIQAGEACGMPQRTVSRHLKMLCAKKIIKKVKEGGFMQVEDGSPKGKRMNSHKAHEYIFLGTMESPK